MGFAKPIEQIFIKLSRYIYVSKRYYTRRTPMKSLNEDIKTGNFKPVYLLYGEEAYLKKQYRDRITKAIFPDGDTVNYA